MAGVNMPGRRADGSLLSTVMKGLAIARDVYGIKEAAARIDELKAEQEAEEFSQSGGLTGPQMAQLQTSGMQEVAAGTPGASKYRVKGPDGTVRETALVKATKPEEPKSATYSWVKGMQGGKEVLKQYADGKPTGVVEMVAPPGPGTDKTPGNTMDLRKEYNALPTTKATGIMSTAFRKIKTTVDRPDADGAGDISLVYSFMKMNDPESAVREGEYATAENSGGVEDKIRNIYNKVLNGQRLTPEQRAAFANQAESLMTAQLEQQAEQDQRYSDLATKFGMDPNYVIDSSFSNLKTSIGQKRPAQGQQGAGQAYAAPGDSVPGMSLDEIDAELKLRGVKPRGATGGF